MNRKYLDKLFHEKNIDALVSVAPQTRLWVSEIQTTDGYTIIEKDKIYVFVDGRYIEYAQNNAKNVEVRLLQGKSLQEFFDQKAYKTVAFETDYIIHQDLERLSKIIKPKERVFVNSQYLRILKDEKEVAILQKAIDISLEALEDLKKEIKPGMTEKEVAAKLNYLMKIKGAEKEGFDEIVATASYSAEPHHHPTDRKIEAGELLKIDFGAQYKGYTADITRTFILKDEKNRITKANNPEAEKILQIVLEAAKAGRDAVRPGIKASEIDKVCRDYITAKGYGQYFTHSTGHGLGIDVHELPSVSTLGDIILEPGMVLTVEPGIYVPGLGGARNEDDVLVVKNGRYVLSNENERDPLEL
ncbi:aminopeptidase P family protein [Mycoplasmopsis opalescens]|uniref:aminopeptidase P family protein n=1 Tax=Mycoplasmopsis opalescens TaxID=114886 RepID=UPI0004A75F15|nr:aminopeptidase P family protein [Mycoplasmopsis opalescens]